MTGRVGNPKDHAVVIGASIAGLCAARVLSDFYSTVTVFERDELPEAPANRATVPQDRHLHMLMMPPESNITGACCSGPLSI